MFSGPAVEIGPIRLGDAQSGMMQGLRYTTLGKLMSDPDPKKSASVMQAMLQMDKIDIEALKRAHEKAA